MICFTMFNRTTNRGLCRSMLHPWHEKLLWLLRHQNRRLSLNCETGLAPRIFMEQVDQSAKTFFNPCAVSGVPSSAYLYRSRVTPTGSKIFLRRPAYERIPCVAVWHTILFPFLCHDKRAPPSADVLIS